MTHNADYDAGVYDAPAYDFEEPRPYLELRQDELDARLAQAWDDGYEKAGRDILGASASPPAPEHRGSPYRINPPGPGAGLPCECRGGPHGGYACEGCR